MYVPILKGKLGELNALEAIEEPTRSSVYPLIEVVPTDNDPEGDVLKLIERMATRWMESAMIDVGYFDLSVVKDGQTLLGFAMNEARTHLNHPVPVVRLTDPLQAYSDAAVHAGGGIGAAIRLTAEDLDVDPDEINDDLAAVLAKINLEPDEVDLILDLAAISGPSAVVGGARLVVSLLRDLNHFSDYRSVTVASGAFPPDLSEQSAWTIGEYPRDDAALYNRVRKRPWSRAINFGDYAIAHPVLSSGTPFAPAPQLRYSVSDRWLTLKASRNDRRGNDQFYEVCATIAAHPAFVGAALGAADARIAAGSPGQPGNATTWRQLGTQHHLDLVAVRLTTLGEP